MDPLKGATSTPWVQSPTVQSLLDKILLGKTIDQVELGELLPEGGLQDQHVHELIDAIAARRKKSKFNIDAPLYAMLYHLSGGADAKLVAPPSKPDDLTRSFGKYAHGSRQAYKGRLSSLKDEARQSPAHLHAAHAASIEQHLMSVHGTGLLDELVLRLRPVIGVAVGVAIGGGGGGPAPDPVTQERAERRASVAWVLACGTHARGGRECPFRKLVGAHTALLCLKIADASVVDIPTWPHQTEVS
jgi:hypothetical protein